MFIFYHISVSTDIVYTDFGSGSGNTPIYALFTRLKRTLFYVWLKPVSLDKIVQKCISPKLCLTQEINSKYFGTGECVGIGQTTVFRIRILHDPAAKADGI